MICRIRRAKRSSADCLQRAECGYGLQNQNVVEPAPGDDEDIRIEQRDYAGVARPVGVHLVVQTEYHRLAVRLDIGGEAWIMGITKPSI